MEHVIAMEGFYSRKVERKETGSTISKEEKEKFKKLKEAQAKVQLGSTPKIRQVVVLLRSNKNLQKYWEPRVVSFGPIHHGKPAYWPTEEYKLMLADKFIGESGKSDEELYDMIKQKIKELREYYDEELTEKYSDEGLAWMLFVDGCATLQLIYTTVNNRVQNFRIKDDQLASVQQDLFLLENQLPFQLLDYLMKISRMEKSLRESINIFINVLSMREETSPNAQNPVHLLDLLRQKLLRKHRSIVRKKLAEFDWGPNRSVQEHRAAGIQLKSSRSSCLRDIIFYRGILRLPPITVNKSTGPRFFNLIAYELSPDFENDYGVSSYISFLDSLIHEAKDVTHLKQAGILHNFLGSDENVVQVFREIFPYSVENPQIYGHVRNETQQYYYKKKVMIWISQTLYTRLNNPLSFPVLAFIGAVLALTFSLVQMIYAILSYEYQRRH